MYDIIANSPVFKGLSETEIETVLGSIHHQVKNYEAETIIAHSGNECENLYVLIEGSVRGEVGNLNDKRIKIEDINAPDTFAEAFLFATESKLLVNIIANTNIKVLIIYKNDLLKLFQSNVQILENYLTIISNRFIVVTKKIKFLSLKTIKGKIANYILNLAQQNKGNKSFRFDKTQSDLSEYFGVTRPSLARTLSSMKDDGLIETNGKEVRILNVIRLKELMNS